MMDRREGYECFGYRSRTELVRAVLAEGVSKRLLTASLEVDVPNVRNLMANAGLWGVREPVLVPERLTKARQAMRYLADALGVNPVVLALRLAAEPGALWDDAAGGAGPAVAEAPDDADAEAADAAAEQVPAYVDLGLSDRLPRRAEVEPVAPPVAAPAAEPADEPVAEVAAAVEAAEGPDAVKPPHLADDVAPEAPALADAVAPLSPVARRRAAEPALRAGAQYMLRTLDGQWLHMSCSQLTQVKAYAWRGSARQLEAVRRRWPKWNELKAEVSR